MQLDRRLPVGRELTRRAGQWLRLCVVALVAYFGLCVVPAVSAALRHGADAGDIRHHRLVLGHLYGPQVAAYLGEGPRAVKLLVLSELALVPILAVLLLLPRRGQLLEGGAAFRHSRWIAVPIVVAHATVWMAMLAGGGAMALAWSWSWRIGAAVLVAGAVEVSFVACWFAVAGKRRWLALLLLVLASLAGVIQRGQGACGVAVLPACADAALLAGRPRMQVGALGGLALWSAFAALALAWRRRIRALVEAQRG